MESLHIFFEEGNTKIKLCLQIIHLQGFVYFCIEILQELSLNNSLIFPRTLFVQNLIILRSLKALEHKHSHCKYKWLRQ